MLRLLLGAAVLVSSMSAVAAKPLAQVAATDPLEASIAGEFALQAGQLPEAARRYLQAAQAASDPVLAERATRIALLANEDALARQGYALWQALAPQPSESRQAVAATLALRAGDKRAARRELRALLATGDNGWKHVLAGLIGAVGPYPIVQIRLFITENVGGSVLETEQISWCDLVF